MPWQPPDGGHSAAEPVKVEDMMLLVDTMLENTSADDEKVQHCNTFTLLDKGSVDYIYIYFLF